MKLRLGNVLALRRLVPVIGAGVAAAALLSYQLFDLAPRLSPSEQALRSNSALLAHVITNPNHLAVGLCSWAAQHAPIVAARIPSVLLALLSVGLFTYLARRWYGRRSMVFGFMLLATNAWLLHIGRLGTIDIEYMVAILALLTVRVRLDDDKDSTSAWWWLVTTVLLLTIPGMVWFVLVNAAWQWRTLWRVFQNANLVTRLTTAGALAATLCGLTVAMIYRSSLLWEWLGIPTAPKLAMLQQLPRAVGSVLLAIGIHGPHRPEAWLGNLPILDCFAFGMFLVGLFFYLKHWRANRTHVLTSFLVLGLILASFNEASYSLLVPLLYLIVLAGMAYVLHFWLQKFPRNPIARTFGMTMITILVLLSCGYNLAQYFVAWPHNPETRAIFTSPNSR